jgi:hypothetical protein
MKFHSGSSKSTAATRSLVDQLGFALVLVDDRNRE